MIQTSKLIKKIVVCAILVLLSTSAFSQRIKYVGIYSEGLARAQASNGKWGFVNETPAWVIPNMYDDSGGFFDEIARVKFEGKWGFIDKRGEVIIPFIYDEVHYFDSEGLALVQFEGKWGMIDKNGNIEVPITYESSSAIMVERSPKTTHKSNILFVMPPPSYIEREAERAEKERIAMGASTEIVSKLEYDVIILQNGSEIKAKVIDISLSEIKYKRFDNIDGPTISISKRDVFAINYENGTREVISSTTANANNRNKNVSTQQDDKVTLGLRAGMNYANLINIAKNSLGVDVKNKLGLQVGLISEMPFKKSNLALKTGLLYSQLGTVLEQKQSAPGLDITETVKITLHSLHFPAHIQYKLGNNNTTLLLHGGFFLDYYFKLDVEYEMTVNGTKVAGDEGSLFNKDNLANDIGIGGGAALLIQNKCHIGVGYDAGLKTRNMMITLTYMIGK